MSCTCYHCKNSVQPDSAGGVFKIGFRDTCPKCHTDLHVCLNCKHYDEGAYHECREPQAEWVKNKEKANVCEYFTPSSGGASATNDKAKALSALDGLFKK